MATPDIPILWLVLGFVPMLGGLYYGVRPSRIPPPPIPAAAATEVV